MRQFFFGKDHFLSWFFVFLCVLIVSLFASLLILQHLSKLQIKSSQQRYESYIVADQMRQSSDDLTKMVRLYVVTGDPKYRVYFNDILAIRRGEKPLPKDYHLIYWDLVTSSHPPVFPEGGEGKPLKERMLGHGFTLEEFALLQKAEHESAFLAKVEIEAMNAREGVFDDGAGNYTVRGSPNSALAEKLVFGKEYMDQKRKVMEPLQEFFKRVELRTEERNQEINRLVLLVLVAAITLAALSAVVMVVSIYRAMTAIHKITSDNEHLLLNILPASIAERLKKGEEPIADMVPQASVLFADIVGFTRATVKYGASKMVEVLNRLFDEFDDLSEKHQVEKVKTIGDNYMAVSGVPVQVPDHAIRLAKFALEMLRVVQEFSEKNKLEFGVRIGMSYGAVVAGVIGHKKFIYDVWGNVVNVASRMESTGEMGKIQISEKMAVMLRDQFEIEERQELEIKGIGKMKTFFLLRRKQKAKFQAVFKPQP